MNSKPVSVAEYFSWLLLKFREFQQYSHQQDAFRVAEIKKNKQGETILKIQVVGKSTLFECQPHEIIGDDKLIEGFSRKDIRTITYFATQERSKPKYKILFQEFRESINRVIFKLSKKGSTDPIDKMANEISKDQSILSELTPKEAHLIGYVTASEQLAQEKEDLNKIG